MNQRDISMTAARPSDLKLNNRMQILELFKSGAVYSVADIAGAVGISRQTVMKAIQFFLEKGIIASDGKASSSSVGGKRAELFTLSARRYLINLVICPIGLYISLFNFRCETIDEYTCEDIVVEPVETIMDAAIAACDRLLERHGIDIADVRGVCVTSSGIMDCCTNRLRFNALFPDWGKDVPIAEKVAAHFGEGVVIRAENVGRVCGSAYLHDTRARRLREVAVFTRWGGIAACAMDRGRILYGKDALIGEIGHMILNPDDPEVCGCGSRGCFERQVSAERLRALAAQWAGEHPDSALAAGALSDLTIPAMFEASAASDSLGRRLSAYAASRFASALRNLTLMFNPDRVIFQGDYAFADDHFRETLYRELLTFHYYDDRPGDDNPFALETDTRSIQTLTTLGAYTLLIDRLFSDETTYS